MEKLISAKNVYPDLSVEKVKNPNKFYAFPILGVLAKFVILFPVFIFLAALGIVTTILNLINPFYVLFQDKYWQTAYDFNLKVMRYSTRMLFFFYGITDTYPGFSLEVKEGSNLSIGYPQAPNKLYAIPLLGFLIRLILLIPFAIFNRIIMSAASIGIFLGAWLVVLFYGRYPDSCFELGRDSVRLMLAQTAYLTGLSDKYPSLYVDFKNHKNIKVVLVVIAIILVFINLVGNFMHKSPKNRQYNNFYSTNYNYSQ